MRPPALAKLCPSALGGGGHHHSPGRGSGRGTVARGSVSRVWLEFTIMYSTLGINEAMRPPEIPGRVLTYPLPARFSTAPEPRARGARRTSTTMPRKSSHEDGVKSKGRSKADKARRNFELHGQYSAKHLRLKESAREAKCASQARQAK